MMRNPNRPTAVATRQFFEFLEQKYGGLPLLRSSSSSDGGGGSGDGDGATAATAKDDYDAAVDAPKVVKRSQLLLKDIQDLLSHKHLALHITNFYPRESARKLGQELAEQAVGGGSSSSSSSTKLNNWKVSTVRGLESSDVFTLGAHQPWNMATSSKEQIDEYFRQVPIEFQQRRRNNNNCDTDTAKILWPLDQLRLELDEIWSMGTNLSRSTTTTNTTNQNNNNNDRCMGGGLPRIMIGPTRWKKGLIHVDELGPLKDDKGCFSANIYLQLPKTTTTTKTSNCSSSSNSSSNAAAASADGYDDDDDYPVLEIWPLNIRTRWDWYRVSTLGCFFFFFFFFFIFQLLYYDDTLVFFI